MEYTVTRQHYGDKQYYQGDTRIVQDDNSAKRLIKLGLIAEKAKPKKRRQNDYA